MNQNFLFKRCSSLLLMFLFVTMFASDTMAISFTESNWSVNYNHCDGYLEIKVHYYDKGGDNDKMDWMDLFYRDNAGTRQKIFGWKYDGLPSPSGSDVTDGDYFEYRFHQSNMNWSFYYEDEDAERVAMIIRWWGYPASLVGTNVQFSMDGYYNGDGSDPEVSMADWQKSVLVNRTDQPTNLSATTDTHCDKVSLTWTNPSISCTGTWAVHVYRENSPGTYTYIGNAGTTGKYDDLTAAKGRSYNYRLQAIYYPAWGGTANASSQTTQVSGRRKGPYIAPSGLAASTERCDGIVKLDWQWNSINPEGFGFYRSTTADFSAGNFTRINIQGDKRSFEDSVPAKNATYYYRMFSINNCGDYSVNSSTAAGFAPDVPAAPTEITATPDNVLNQIVITWKDNANNETGFIVQRTLFGGGGVSTFNVGPNATQSTSTYIDNTLVNCQTYSYEILAKNACSAEGQGSGTSIHTKLIPDLSGTFSPGSLKVSKGYYPNLVRLTWTNANQNQINTFKIFRKILGSPSSPVLIATVNSGSALYNDYTADAGVMYEYSILAEGVCENSTLVSNSVSDVGFRSPSGIINGHVSYRGGIAVEGVRVIVSKTSGATGKSLYFNGASRLEVAHSDKLMPASDLTISAWVRPESLASDMTFMSKSSGDNGYVLEYIASTDEVLFRIHDGAAFRTASFAGGLTAGDYTNLTGTFDGTNVKLYVNGELKATTPAGTSIAPNSSNLSMGTRDGAATFFNGYLDEVLVWNVARTAEDIERDYSRVLNGNEAGLVAYWRMDEGTGNYLYDVSYSNNIYNEHHAAIVGAGWSAEIPAATQLGLVGITNASGNYTISNVIYNGVGETFTLTPFFETHRFDPSTKVLFVGDGASVHNNQDFTDISSFKVTGSVKFRNTSCYAKDVLLKIDGNLVIKEGEPVKTLADGTFEIEVPIGNHKVSVEKSGHVFETGVFPVNGSSYDFQAPVSGIEFIDSTLITVVGRVVGGIREGNKPPAMGRSKNNIGVAAITFTAQQNGGCTYQSWLTNDSTGEYIAKLPPLNYIVSELKIPSNLSIDFGVLDLIDLSGNLEYKKVVDTIFIAGTKLPKQIDSAKFHLRKDYIYRTAPEMLVLNNKTNTPFTGDTVALYIDQTTQDTTKISLAGEPFGYPVFTGENIYQARISVFEKYINRDGGPGNFIEDNVPVTDGKLTINNNIGSGNTEIINLTKGDTLYTFRASQPNVLADNTNPEYSYTKTFQVLAEVGPHGIAWQPRTDGDKLFRGFVFGAKSKGNAFATQGPQVVDMILRDPPGSSSYAFIEQGTTTTNIKSWEVVTSESLSFEKNVKLGTEFTVGLGMQTPTKITNNLVFNTTIESSVTPSGEHRETVMFNEGYKTSSSPSEVGAASDIFIGKAQNVIFGATDNLYLLPDNVCSLAGITCTGISHNGFQIGKRSGIFIVPGGTETMFVYDQDHIENFLIPDIKRLRNNLFVQNPSRYTSKLPGSHASYGTNNDDPVWGLAASSNDPAVTTTPADYDGPSYTFTPGSGNAGNIDSVRHYNQQIRLWQEALAKNEKEKMGALFERNISFNAGPEFTYTHTSETEETSSLTWELGITEDIRLVLGAEVGGAGFEIENHLALSIKGGETKSDVTVESTTYGYLLEDDNNGDYFSVDVKKCLSGNGPVFKTVAGKSSCPFEKAVVSKYHMPGTELSAATMQREVPTIEIRPNKLVNVPSDQQAVFNLSLGNESASDDDMNYVLKVLENTNPFGAIIEVDGASPNRTFDVLAGTSINKQLTVKKGPVENIYNDISVVFQSGCDNISDTVTFSVHFLPTCSPITFMNPEHMWVVNNSFNDTLPVVIGGYDINYESLKRLQFQYKSSSSAEWINLQNFWKDTAGLNDLTARLIPVTDFYTTYPWELSQLPDGDYDIRAVTQCTLADVSSETFSGHIDRVNPHPFGNPQPADGILSPNDEILIQFNEVIDAGKLTLDNFDVRAVLNGTPLRHGASVYFDGDAAHFMEIPDGLNLVRSSFSLEFWAKRNRTGEEVIVSQGRTEAEAIYAGFDAADKFKFSIAGNEITSNTSVTDNQWHHYVCTYDANKLEAQLYIDGASAKVMNSFEAIYDATGLLYAGKSSFAPSLPFQGHMHELRIWKSARTQAEIVANLATLLSGREIGLAGNWRMDEAFGAQAKDYARSRHALVKAAWAVEPSGRALTFDGADDHMEINAGQLAFTREMDFTVEFWFKGTNASNVCLFSNGKGDGTDSNPDGWAIATDANGNIKAYNNGKVFNAADGNFFDNNWHHFALVVRRLGNTMAFVDGNLKGSATSGDWSAFGGSKIWVGARGWYTGSLASFDQHFAGKMDEVRIWSSARVQDQIQRDMNSRLSGDEFGLRAYYPFESYTESAGVMILAETMDDQSAASNAAAVFNGAAYSLETPAIKLKRPIQKVNFSYSVNQDKIIITPTDPAYLIENCILDITVKDVRDLSNNKMQSPATWSAYMDKNQVVWEDLEKNFQKEFGAELTFKARILNNGGNQFDYTIGNLPAWLTATPSSGQISPKSSLEISFRVDPAVNIGSYSQNLHLTTSFGFDEILVLNLDVSKNPPADWKVNPDDYQYTMNIIGQVSIGGIISTDKNDMIAAFVGNECRGVASLEYVPAYDMYEAFLSVFSNQLSGETVTFRIWNASEGKIQSKVTPDFGFVANASHGTPSVPVIFNAANYIIQEIPLARGWKWVSFNLNSPALANLNMVMKDLSPVSKDLIKGIQFYDEYSPANGWIGTITSNGGLKMEEMYKIKLSRADTIVLEGERPDPSVVPVNIVKGWNWIGFVSQRNIPVNEALAGYNATSGDLIKSQYRFAVYDVNNGWVGNLSSLSPGEGYMFKAEQPGTFTYPKPAISSARFTSGTSNSTAWDLTPEDFRDNMSLIAKVKGTQPDSNHVLGAFVNGACRGISLPEYNGALGENTYFMTIYSNNAGETVHFRWLDAASGTAYKVIENIHFENNRLSGAPAQPISLTLGAEEKNQTFVYPNPLEKAAFVKLNLQAESKVTVEVFDLLGNKVATVARENKPAGEHIFTWNAGQAAQGVYFVKVTIGNDPEIFKVLKY